MVRCSVADHDRNLWLEFTNSMTSAAGKEQKKCNKKLTKLACIAFLSLIIKVHMKSFGKYFITNLQFLNFKFGGFILSNE